jgi:hypothetical protein
MDPRVKAAGKGFAGRQAGIDGSKFGQPASMSPDAARDGFGVRVSRGAIACP